MIEQNQLIDIVLQMEVPLRIDERLIHLNLVNSVVASITPNSFFIMRFPPLCSFSPKKSLPFLINILEKEGEVFILLQHFLRDQDNIIIGIIFNNRIIWNV